jgi:hypothetical protein
MNHEFDLEMEIWSLNSSFLQDEEDEDDMNLIYQQLLAK